MWRRNRPAGAQSNVATLLGRRVSVRPMSIADFVPKGNIVVDTIEYGNGPVSMTVTKGTKHFKGIAGSGSGSLSSFANLKLGMKTKGHFTLTVNLNVTMPTS
jgi:hypothetical protein